MNKYRTEALIIGAGGAGLRAGVTARQRGRDVFVVNKGVSGETGCTANSASDWMAYGAAFGHADPNDSSHQHWIDILIKGGLICRPELSKKIAYEAPERLLELERMGAKFSKTPDGKFKQILSDGATYPRACGSGTATGPIILNALYGRAKETGVGFKNNFFVVDLLLDENRERVVGCWGIDLIDNTPAMIFSDATIITTGGAGGIYELNAFPEGMYGDGYAMAFRAGAELINMEFVQIGPNIVHPVKFALSGVFWRMNPRITNRNGEEFISKYIPEGVDINKAIYIKGVSYPFTVRNESKWVDVAVFSEIVAGRGTKNNGIWLDISHNERKEIIERAKVPYQHLLEKGIDITKQKLEFAPSVQHFNGGILIDENAKSTVPGLFSAGESAGGQHGADRPGGNALADCQVFGNIAGLSASERAVSKISVNENDIEKRIENEYGNLASKRGDIDEATPRMTILQKFMWRNCCVVRTKKGLDELTDKIKEIKEELSKMRYSSIVAFIELKNALNVAESVALSALNRKESRGTHYREDFPERDDGNYLCNFMIKQGSRGNSEAKSLPVILPAELEYLKDKLE